MAASTFPPSFCICRQGLAASFLKVSLPVDCVRGRSSLSLAHVCMCTCAPVLVLLVTFKVQISKQLFVKHSMSLEM